MNEEYNIIFFFGVGKKVSEFVKDFFVKYNYSEDVILNICKKSFKMKILE